MEAAHGDVKHPEDRDRVRQSRSRGRWSYPAWGLLAVVVLGGIIYLSLAPVWDPDLPGPLDQLPHAAAYGLLTLVLLAGLSRSKNGGEVDWIVAVAIALSLVVLGSAMELAQAITGRDVQSADAVANAVGIAVALAGWLCLQAARRINVPEGRHSARRPDARAPQIVTRSDANPTIDSPARSTLPSAAHRQAPQVDD
jgi:VanZ family protein